jgi:hypothetical protein
LPNSVATATRKVLGFFSNFLPCTLHMPQSSVRLADAKTQRKPIVQPGVAQIKLSALVQAIHKNLITRITAAVSEANKVEWYRSR